MTIQNVYAISPVWENIHGEPIKTTIPSGGGVVKNKGVENPIRIHVEDPSQNKDPDKRETISVRVTSSTDSIINMTLIEEDKNSSNFQSVNLVMAKSANILFMDKSYDITVNSDKAPVLLNVISESDPKGIDLHILEETRPGSKKFIGTFKVGQTTDKVQKVIGAKSGDVISVINIGVFPRTQENAIVDPDKDSGKGIIVVNGESFVRAEYDEMMSSDLMVEQELGIGRPGFSVGDDPSSGSSCRGDCTPPTLGVYSKGKRIVDNGFSFNGNATDVEHYYTPYPLITANVGEENITVLKIYEDQGPQHIKHVEIAFGLGKGERISDSKAVIEWDRKFDGTETVTLFDPENALEDVRVDADVGECGTSVIDVECLIVTIYHTFREPLDFNMVGTYVWDFRRNGWQNYYNHGVEIAGESMNPPKQFQTTDKGQRITVIQTDKTTGIDENGYVWNFDSRTNSWKKDYVHNHREMLSCDESIRGYERHCIQFAEEKINQENIAKNTMTEILIHEIIYWEKLYDPVPTPQGKHLKRSEDPVLQNTITYEIKRAQEVFDIKYDLREDQLDAQ